MNIPFFKSLKFNFIRRIEFKYFLKWFFLFPFLLFLISSCSKLADNQEISSWDISIIPSSVRIDPLTSEVIEAKFKPVPVKSSMDKLLEKNWIFDGQRAELHSARGEYVSFQLVVRNNSDELLDGIIVEMDPFRNESNSIKITPELFLEWSVEVKALSTGYPESSLGTGWYPDALIPFEYIQYDSSKVTRRWTYPLQLPDFNNRIPNQKCLFVWVDQFVPYNRDEALPGKYSSEIRVRIQDKTESISVDLNIWDFAIPNENNFRASLQHEGFLSRAPESPELELFQILKKHRVSVMDPTYRPGLNISDKGEVSYNWENFDNRLEKYFTGEAFTEAFGYDYGPGYGEPVENFLLPFDVYGKHGGRGWPDTGEPDVERDPGNKAIYVSSIQKFRDHLLNYINPDKTMLTVYLNGLDESYFPEAWDRMVYYGEMFRQYFPESYFRIDGGYTEEAMAVVSNSISAWGSHTINYNIDEIERYRKLGIKDWIYGPLIYESRINSWVGSSTFIDLPLVNERAISWACYKYGTFSWLSWGIGAGWKAAWYDCETWKDYSKRLNGNGALLYAPDIVPNVGAVCPSIRLKNMRNGIQEYEYLKLLESLKPDKDYVKELVNSIIKEPFGKNSIGNIDIWSYDPEEWDNLRLQIGKEINILIQK